MKWVNTYIPILSEKMIKYIQSFMPFIMGLEKSMFDIAKNYMDQEDIYLVFINRNLIELCVHTNKKTQKINKKNLR